MLLSFESDQDIRAEGYDLLLAERRRQNAPPNIRRSGAIESSIGDNLEDAISLSLNISWALPVRMSSVGLQ